MTAFSVCAFPVQWKASPLISKTVKKWNFVFVKVQYKYCSHNIFLLHVTFYTMALCCHGNFLYKLGRPPSKLAQLQQKWSSTTFLLLSNRLMMVFKVNSVIWGSAATPADLHFSLKYSSLSTIWTQEKNLKVAEMHVAVQRLYTSLHTLIKIGSLNLTAWIIFTGILS